MELGTYTTFRPVFQANNTTLAIWIHNTEGAYTYMDKDE